MRGDEDRYEPTDGIANFSRIRLEVLVSVKLRTGGIHVVMTKPAGGAVEYRSFQIYSMPAPVLRELLGHISAWYLAGSIDYRRRDRSLVELARFRLRCLELDDQDVAEAFGLEVGRLIVDVCYRDLVIKRYETERAGRPLNQFPILFTL